MPLVKLAAILKHSQLKLSVKLRWRGSAAWCALLVRNVHLAEEGRKREGAMAESRPVPCNLLSSPRVAGLLPDQKLIVAYLWFNRFTSAAGCYQIPIPMASVELGLSETALSEALRDFEKRELILYDQKTSEIFIIDWFRFHKFASSAQNRQLDMATRRIESEILKNSVLHKINLLRANGNSNSNSNKSFCTPDKKADVLISEKPKIIPATPQQLSRLFEKMPHLQELVS
jgi:hypothetical protein